MSQKTADALALLGAIAAILIVVVSCVLNDKNMDKNAENFSNFAEWVSPDGVHYWYKDGAYGESWLAPRIDKNGNFVIDP